jgi:hypothetical protein
MPTAYRVSLGTSPRATLSGRAALLTQEGVARLQIYSFMCTPHPASRALSLREKVARKAG